MNIDKLTDINSKLKDWNESYGAQVVDTENVSNEKRKLNTISIELDRLKRAQGTRTALGVFGQSQCGKSYLTSELIGGANTKLIIEGKDNCRFHDFNQNDADKESTALVTRLTSKKDNYTAPANSVMIRYLSAPDIMWSFVYGFYKELLWLKGFTLDDNKIKEIENTINSIDNSKRMMPDIEILGDEFFECLNWINQNYTYEYSLADIASDYFSNHEEISLEKYVELVSTLWKSDENLTKAFRARIETLYSLNFAYNGSIPEALLKKVLDASSLDKLSLDVTQKTLIISQNGDLVHSEADDVQIANIQAVIKEVCLLADIQGNSLASKIDILDFPGARALTGMDGGLDSQELNNSIKDNKSVLIANVYKRGKLSYLFDLYKKDFDISLLVFCTESGSTQEAKSLRKMLSGWVDMYKNDSNELKDPSLFVAFTKSDKLIRSNTIEKPKNADTRITARFKENFQDSFGDWTENYIDKNNPFNNIYLVRNPIADNICFDIPEAHNNGEIETWRTGFEEGKDILRDAWLNNVMVNKYLGDKKTELFDNVFEPNEHGIDHLIDQINKKFDSEPNKKEKYLKSKIEDVKERMLSYVNKYSPNTSEAVAQEEQRKLANTFINKVESKYENVALILNAIHETCPDSSYLVSLIDKSTNLNTGGAPIRLGSPLERAVPKFIENWFSKLNKHNSLSSDLAINKSDLELFFNNLKKYILRKEKLFEILDPFKSFNLIGDPAHVKALRNYLVWHVGEKVYYLEYIEQNGTPNKVISIPDELDFRDFILNEVWKKQLPEIYAGNFQMKLPQAGSNKLIEIGEMF